MNLKDEDVVEFMTNSANAFKAIKGLNEVQMEAYDKNNRILLAKLEVLAGKIKQLEQLLKPTLVED